jgi:hypothetical protein
LIFDRINIFHKYHTDIRLTKFLKLMNKINASKLWKIIQEAGDYLRDYRLNLFHIKLHYSTVLMRILKS